MFLFYYLHIPIYATNSLLPFLSFASTSNVSIADCIYLFVLSSPYSVNTSTLLFVSSMFLFESEYNVVSSFLSFFSWVVSAVLTILQILLINSFAPSKTVVLVAVTPIYFNDSFSASAQRLRNLPSSVFESAFELTSSLYSACVSAIFASISSLKFAAFILSSSDNKLSCFCVVLTKASDLVAFMPSFLFFVRR